eukprot:CAMPEP_0172560430 /NCGR_PEP_ID=MMETSP1067-20121228/88654_1 /TAXON_ID=265564 ORGANISM="Thalassiosira punctigera, Strain Tpunct2005C2" /NCGR_SAMPLE_ID=MMETSP1067 /ASSEMBLY_ACC=CAM_ASM_000444 /LENGTH=1363 /DNA_ID=CAMNT_0013350221 /DNA_START=178 /DNA_END=4266 /DNA_ORIENTATION=-
MFLLPAIGAWISDGLILYLYFSGEGRHGSVTKKNEGGGGLNDFVVCGNDNIIGCRRIPALVSPHSLFHNDRNSLQKSHVISSFPKPPKDNDSQDEIQRGVHVFSTKPIEPEHKSLPFAPEDGSSKIDKENDDPDKVGISASTIESKTRYLSTLAIIRLILLTFPLSYAAYSGTRVPCVIAQYLFQGLSAMIVVSHMLAVLILTGTAIDPTAGGDTSLEATVNSSNNGDAWTLLSLSLVSILLHFLIILHVRSTGPIQDGLYEEKRKRKRLAYAMAGRTNGATDEVREFRGRGGLGSNGAQINGNDSYDEEEMLDETQSPLLLGENDLNGNRDMKDLSLKEKFLCLPDQYEAFLSDTQARFDVARRMWADRLEIMTQSLQQNNLNNSTHGDGRSLQSPPRNLESSNLLTHAISNATKLVKPDPFRVLLQLFAYEDVWSSNQLDNAFASPATDGTNITSQLDDGDRVTNEGSAALSFYAPQLLSFLLHGAYFDISSKLEEWILKKCGQDLHFAHRCFWFLRSWCLGSSSERNSSHVRSLSSTSAVGGLGRVDISSLEPETGFQHGSAVKLRGVESNLYLSSSQALLPAAPPLFRDEETTSPGADLPAGFAESSSSKFTPDEEELIAGLLRRVVERGSRPAAVAQYGSIDGRVTDDCNISDALSVFTRSPSALATAVEEGLVPVDPRTGFHSTAHLDCITSPHKHGFLPLSKSGEPYQKPSSSYDAAFFFAAPIFLDAMLSIADDLMNTSRSNRTVELRQRLRGLEVELLPSNVVYLPIRNIQHRVWRIVADESLALSTNERVPCIITLEVVSDSYENQFKSVSNNDSAIISSWVSAPRPPYRHSTLIDKVANYTQEGLKRLEDTIDHLSHHGDGKSRVLDRRLSDFLGGLEKSRTNSQPSHISMGSNDDDDEYIGQDEETTQGSELSEVKLSSNNGTKEKDDIMQIPPPPLGGPLLSDNLDDAPKTPKTPTISSGIPENDVPDVPEIDVQQSPMGQWSTPVKGTLSLRKRNNISSIENIAEEDSGSDVELSPQAKQRKKVVFPPSSTSMTRSESFDAISFDDAQHQKVPAESEDTDVTVLKTGAPDVVFKEDWKTKTERLRKCSVYGSNPGWRLLPILIKSNDDLRQEQLASQLIQRMALILAKSRVQVWLYPYEIVSLTGRGGIIECVPDTISIDSLKRNDPNFTSLKRFFGHHFGPGSEELSNAKANFVESLAAYSIVCFLMQIKDRHNGNILLDNKGHVVHIDFGFYFLSSPGRNTGFESAPFKLTRDFVSLMDGPDSRTFQKYRELCYKTFIELRKHCYQIILLVEMLVEGNEDLACFRGRPDDAVRQLKERFRLDLNDNGIRKYVDSLIDESLENWRTRW